jgi:hypothetical protein
MTQYYSKFLLFPFNFGNAFKVLEHSTLNVYPGNVLIHFLEDSSRLLISTCQFPTVVGGCISGSNRKTGSAAISSYKNRQISSAFCGKQKVQH